MMPLMPEREFGDCQNKAHCLLDSRCGHFNDCLHKFYASVAQPPTQQPDFEKLRQSVAGSEFTSSWLRKEFPRISCTCTICQKPAHSDCPVHGVPITSPTAEVPQEEYIFGYDVVEEVFRWQDDTLATANTVLLTCTCSYYTREVNTLLPKNVKSVRLTKRTCQVHGER